MDVLDPVNVSSLYDSPFPVASSCCFGRYFHRILNLCLIYNLSQMYVNIFIANFEFRYVNLVKFIVYMCYTPYLVFMSAPYPSHESWHIKR